MKKRNDLPDLSRAEYDILRILWKDKRLTVREVHDRLQGAYQWAYSTTKTMMDRMVSKGLLERGSFHGIYLYRPLISRPHGMAKMIRFFADRVLELDTGTVVSLFARSKAISLEEMKELDDLLKNDKKED